jgi:SAM-dependent methyltransferase
LSTAKQILSATLRNVGLLYVVDKLFYLNNRWQNRRRNARFLQEHPNVKLPPDYLMFESFQLDYYKYFEESKQSAKWVADHYKRHSQNQTPVILDWGCGPGRVIRHLPYFFEAGATFFGTDYNADSIKWCSHNLPGISFNHNGLEAKLPYEDDTFDFIYGISIFTHLSEPKHREWFLELKRVLKSGGVMLLTTQGDNFKTKLTPNELERYNAGELVVRGNVKEGHRTYSAFQPKAYMRNLFVDVTILEHIERKPESGRALPQDVWLIEKKNN